MGSEDIRRGTRVRGCRRRPTLEGLEGTITRRFGGERYVAFEVSLDGGGTELFRPYELEEASEQSVSEKSLPPVVSEKIPLRKLGEYGHLRDIVPVRPRTNYPYNERPSRVIIRLGKRSSYGH
jgi:hypothetical protein